MKTYKEMYKTICRVCLKSQNVKNMVSLTDNSTQHRLSCYGEAVMVFANICISNDSLPNQMCRNCLFMLKQAIMFKKNCESSQSKLDILLRRFRNSKMEFKQNVCEYVMFSQFFGDEIPRDSKLKHKSTKVSSKISRKRKKTTDKPRKNGTQDYHDFEDTFHSTSPLNEDNINCTEKDISVNENICTFPDNIKQMNASLSTKKEKESLNTQDDDDILDRIQKLIYLQQKEITRDENDETLNSIKELITSKPELITSPITTENILVRGKMFKQKMLRQKISRKARLEVAKNIQCKLCNKTLANLSTYKHHMKRHNHSRYICEHCAKKYATYAELQYHLASTHDIGPHHVCKVCGFKAARRFDLVEHERIHTGERPFACDKCGMTFRRQFIWKKHALYHMERTVQCPQCPRKFFQRSELMAHINNIHERAYIYSCSQCDVTYARSTTVRRHLTEKHGIAREMQGRITKIRLSKPSVK